MLVAVPASRVYTAPLRVYSPHILDRVPSEPSATPVPAEIAAVLTEPTCPNSSNVRPEI